MRNTFEEDYEEMMGSLDEEYGSTMVGDGVGDRVGDEEGDEEDDEEQGGNEEDGGDNDDDDKDEFKYPVFLVTWHLFVSVRTLLWTGSVLTPCRRSGHGCCSGLHTSSTAQRTST